MNLTIAPHPLLDVRAFVSEFPRPLGELSTPPSVLALLSTTTFPVEAVPLQTSDGVREAIRSLLRQGGFKPTGRSKPASEYLLKAVAESQLSSINLAVDTCNAVSYRSGLPISVVDLEKAQEPFQIRLAGTGETYIFNASGQWIDVEGLLCLFDASGPCANAVKDAQRTKTNPESTHTLSILWGTKALPNRSADAEKWYRQLLYDAGVKTTTVSLHHADAAR